MTLAGGGGLKSKNMRDWGNGGVQGPGFNFRLALWDKSSLMSWQRKMEGAEKLWELGQREQGSEEEERGGPGWKEGKWLWRQRASCWSCQTRYMTWRADYDTGRGENSPTTWSSFVNACEWEHMHRFGCRAINMLPHSHCWDMPLSWQKWSCFFI